MRLHRYEKMLHFSLFSRFFLLFSRILDGSKRAIMLWGRAEVRVYVVGVGLILLIVVNTISEAEALSWRLVLLCCHLVSFCSPVQVIVAPADPKANTPSKRDGHTCSAHIYTIPFRISVQSSGGITVQIKLVF